MNIVENLLEYFVRCNVRHFFGITGYASSPVFTASVSRNDITPIITKNESGAGWMAYGYGLEAAPFGVCVTTKGGASINVMPAVNSAFARSVSLLVISGEVDTSSFGKGGIQETTGIPERSADIVNIMKLFTKMSVRVKSAESFPEIMEKAHFALTKGRKGPVHINIPADIQLKKCEPMNFNFLNASEEKNNKSVYWDVMCVMETLKKASSPFVIFGNGCRDCRKEAAEWVEKYNIPFANTMQAKGGVSTDSLNDFGAVGLWGSVRAHKYLLEECDLIIAVGSSLNEATTFKSADWLFRDKKIIRVDIDINEINRVCKPDIAVISDAKQFFNTFDEVFQSVKKKKQYRIDFRKEGIRHAEIPLKRVAEKIKPKKGLMSPVEVCGVIEKMMPKNTVFLGEGGNSGFLAAHYLKTSQGQSYYLDINTGTLGQTIAASIGVKTSGPHKHVVSLCGDGAFLMNANELATAAEYDIPVIWIVFNNGCYGSVLSGDKKRFGTVVDPYFKKTDITTIARGFGVRALEVVDMESLHNAIALSIKLNKPMLIDIKTNPEYEPAFFSYEPEKREEISTG